MVAPGIPVLRTTIEVPELLFDAARVNNEIVKTAIREEAFKHWRQRIPRHFQQGATGKYGYAKRQSLMRAGNKWISYNTWKARKHKSRRDLVKTGATQREMTSRAKITVGGAAEGGKKPLTVTLRLRFPFRGGTGRFRKSTSRQAVTIDQMAKEIQAVTPDELRDISLGLQQRYVKIANGPEFRRRKRRTSI